MSGLEQLRKTIDVEGAELVLANDVPVLQAGIAMLFMSDEPGSNEKNDLITALTKARSNVTKEKQRMIGGEGDIYIYIIYIYIAVSTQAYQ